jgi:hypothetical protein
MLISLHLPKTAGESFYNSLRDHYGDRLLRDYDDKPINTPPCRRNLKAMTGAALSPFRPYRPYECIHGHFLPLKYRFIPNAVFITWMRNPLERLASHYHWWFRSFDPETAPPLRRKVVRENWSLEQFCFAPEFRNFYSQFLWGFPLDAFSFIGITEYFQDDLAYFHRQFLNEDRFTVYEKKTNPVRPAESYFKDEGFRKEVMIYHSADLDIYRRALEMRAKRP